MWFIAFSLVGAAILAHVISYYVSGWLKGLPSGPIPLPLIGNIHLLGTAPHVSMKSMSKKYGDIYRLYFGSSMAIIVNNIEPAREGLVNKSTDFAGRPKTYTLDLTSGDGKGIAFVDYGPMWRLVRKIGHSSLRMYGEGLKVLEDLIIKESDELHKRFDSMIGKSINPHHNLALAIMNVICAMIFGNRYDLEDEEFLNIVYSNVTFVRAFEYDNLVDIFPVLRYLPNRRLRMIQEALGIRDPILERKIREHRETLDENNVRDLTDALIVAAKEAVSENKETKKFLTDHHLLKVLDDMFGAGSETTTTTMRWALLYLTKWPNIQDKAYAEIMSIVGPNRLPDVTDRSSLPYCEAVVHEVLRMACIAPFAVPHKTTKDTTLQGYKFPKDTQVFFNIWALHYDDREWSEPEKFIPERFLDCNGNLVPTQRSYLPFSAGRRVCLAEPLAKMELYLLLSRMLSRYRFEEDPNEPLPDLEGIYGLFLAPKPYKVVTRRRENSTK